MGEEKKRRQKDKEDKEEDLGWKEKKKKTQSPNLLMIDMLICLMHRCCADNILHKTHMVILLYSI